MSTAGKLNRKPRTRRRSREDLEWNSIEKINRHVERGWQYFWAKRGMVPPMRAKEFDFNYVFRKWGGE
jgi:hypothetical protein